MKMLRTLAAVMALTIATDAISAAAPDSFAPIVDPLLPAVVNISTTQKVPQQTVSNAPMFKFQGDPNNPQLQELLRQFNQQFGGMQAPAQREVNSLGSGFVIDPDGYVVTNNHVVGNADVVTVIFQDNKRLTAKIVGRDPKTDLALLKVKADKPLPFVKFADSATTRVGDWVIAIGNPFGLGGSVSAGIVSARGRNINAGPFDDFIQTDAAINRGNSGGPLFNTRGEVVGVNSAIFSPTGGNIGIGFAVPANMVKNIVGQLRESGTIRRGWLGVQIGPVTEELADSLGLGKPRGVLLAETNKNGPAAKAGLEAGDVLLKYDGNEITEARSLPRMVADTKIGKKVELTYWRKGREEKASVTVGELPKDEVADNDPDNAPLKPGKEAAKDQIMLGMRLLTLTPQLRTQLGLNGTISGVFVDAVDTTQEAAKRGIRPGDIIVEANEAAVSNTAGVKNAIAAAKKAGRNFILLRVLRGEELAFVTLALK